MKVAILYTGKSWHENTINQNGYVLATNFNESINNHREYFLNHYSHDIFIHTWKHPYINKLIDTYNPKSILVEDSKDFSKFSKINISHASQHYSIHKANELKNIFQFQSQTYDYDLVIKMRFDTIFFKKIELNTLDKNKFNVSKYRGKYMDISLNDILFCARPEIMNIVCSLYNYMPDYNELIGSSIRSDVHGSDVHALLHHHVSKFKIPVCEIFDERIDYNIERRSTIYGWPNSFREQYYVNKQLIEKL